MDHQDVPHDPTPGSGTPSPADDHIDGHLDDHIDARARAAGSALRRPAPAGGIAEIRRAGRRRRAVQTGAAGAALAVVAVVGVVAIGSGDRRTTLVPATADTTGTSSEVTETTGGTTATSVLPTAPETPNTPPVTPSTIEPPVTEPADGATTTTAPATPGSAGPSVVYGSDTAIDTGDSIQTQYDPLTGTVLSTEPMDGAASLAAQQEGYGGGTWPVEYVAADESDRPGTIEYELAIGGLVLRHAVLPSEIPTLDDQDPAALTFFDRCQQAELVVLGASTALPGRALAVSASADGRYLTVLRVDCPVAGTLDEALVAGGYDVIAEVYDLTALDAPGRELFREPFETCGCTLAGYSYDSGHVAIRQFASGFLFRAFDLESGDEVDVAPGCVQSFTAFADQYGPWVGDTELAVVADCGDGPSLRVIDASGVAATLTVPAPTAVLGWAEVDVEHLADPVGAWYVLCGSDDPSSPATCWVGHGGAELVELPGVATASFLPLGFRAGG